MTLEQRSGQSIQVFNGVIEYSRDVRTTPEYIIATINFNGLIDTLDNGLDTALQRIASLDQIIQSKRFGKSNIPQADQLSEIWNTDLSTWDFDRDPHGLNLLELEKEKDKLRIINSGSASEEAKRLANAKSAGEMLMINKYQELVQS